jgi:hypothetical protein
MLSSSAQIMLTQLKETSQMSNTDQDQLTLRTIADHLEAFERTLSDYERNAERRHA